MRGRSVTILDPEARAAIRPRKTADLLAARIRRQIAAGELRVGDWLPTEPELIERYGVSRPTLREAFRLLEADSLVRVRRGPPGGAQVSLPGPDAAAPVFALILTMSGTTLADVFEARLAIEPPAARRLAETGDAAAHAAFAEEADLMAAAVSAARPFGPASATFHQRLVELAGNRTLATVVGMLMTITARHGAAAHRLAPRAAVDNEALNRTAVRSYRRLVRLVLARDGVGAESHWASHIRATREFLVRDLGADDREIIDVIG